MGWGKKTEKDEYVNANVPASTGGSATGVQEPPKQEAPVSTGSQGTPASGTPAPASNGWKKVENKQDGNFFKFEKEGEELVGIWQGSYNAGKNTWGRDNINGKIVTPEGTALVTMNDNLTRQLGNVATGKRVKIVFHGKKFNKKSGNYYKDFEVFVEE